MATNVLAKEMHPSLGMCVQVRARPLESLAEKVLNAAAAEVSPSCEEPPPWIFRGLGSEHSEKLVHAAMVHNENVLNGLDKREESHSMKLLGALVEPKVLPKNYLLSLELQALLDASVNALKDDTSGQNTQKVLLSVLTQTLRLAAMRAETTDTETQAAMLEVMERSAQFVEANVTVSQFNTQEATGVRTLVFNVYHRLAKVLGRNTPEAVKADTKSMLIALGDRIVHRPGQGRRDGGAPSQHITTVIAPEVDPDMRPLLFLQSTYNSVPSMKNFHTLIGMWRKRGKDLGEIREG